MRSRTATALCSTLLVLATTFGVSQPGTEDGITAILPNGRRIHPVGTWTAVAPYPFAIALKPDGSEAAVPSIGFPFALNILRNPDGKSPIVQRLPALRNVETGASDPKVEVHAGLAYAPDGQTLYVATGNSGKIALYSTADWSKQGEISLDQKIGPQQFTGSFAASVIVSADGRELFALDQGNFRVAVIDLAARRVSASIPTGAYPFGQALSPDGARLYVTNIGLFEYQSIPGAKHENELGTGLRFAPFGYPSAAARTGVTAEGRKLPGLGSENSTRGSSLWTYDVENAERPALIAKLRLGDPISEERNGRVGGAAPTGVVASNEAVYVSLAHQDSIVEVSADGRKVLGETALSPFVGKRFQDAQGRPLRGVMPSGLALSNGKLYVAESGIDAVGVLDASSMRLVEHIPAGWNPSAVSVSADGKTLFIVNTKGKGTGPNGGMLHDPNAPTYVGALEYGSVSAVPLAGLASAEALTAEVLANNTYAIDNSPALPRLKHCFLVIRENRTYDEILGDLPGGNGDSALARYGVDGWAEELGKASTATNHFKVTPNIHALAAHFAISDNYFVDSDVSVDGHRWVVGINPTAFMNTAWTSGYGGRRKSDPEASQPGRRALFGASDSPMPEDEPQFGTLWEHIAGSGLGILNYGEGIEVEGSDELDGAAPEGQRLFLNAPVPKPVFEHSDRRYPTFNLGIPDQFRVEEFERDFTRRLAQGSIPGLVVIRLPNDHTAVPRAADGYPYRASYVADNDLALGRIVDFLSKTNLWKDSAMFVTEDDAQAGVDHVDAHRSVLLVASAWVTPGTVSHQHSSMGSITRTMDELLGLGPLNLEDALAGELNGIFAATPHMEAFTHLPSDTRIFDPAMARLAKPKTKEESAELKDIDDVEEIQKHLEKTKAQLRRPTKDDD